MLSKGCTYSYFNRPDSDVTLDSKFLVFIYETIGSDPTKITHITQESSETSLVLPSMNKDSGSLMKTEEFLQFVD